MEMYRVALRAKIARENLGVAFQALRRAVLDRGGKDGQAAIEAFMKKLGVIKMRDGVSIRSEWIHNLDGNERERFEDVVGVLNELHSQLAFTPEDANSQAKHRETLENYVDLVLFDLDWLQEEMRDESDEFTHGPFKIIPMKGVVDPKDAVETLDKAASIVSRKFPKVLYGKVYVRKDLRIEGTYKARPGKVAGGYVAATDTINLSMYATANRDSVKTLIHELGHRYHTRFLKGDDREAFIQLHEVGDVQEVFLPLRVRYDYADEYIARLRKFRDTDFSGAIKLSKPAEDYFGTVAHRDNPRWKTNVSPLLRRFNEGENSVEEKLRDELAQAHFGGNLRVRLNERTVEPLYASDYGRTNWQENFAETFLAYCIGDALPEPLKRFMDRL